MRTTGSICPIRRFRGAEGCSGVTVLAAAGNSCSSSRASRRPRRRWRGTSQRGLKRTGSRRRSRRSGSKKCR
ncbi:unnamed protein product [Ectocarpus sp. 8 AP-2014]